MDGYYGEKPSRGIGQKLLICLLIAGIVAASAFAGIGVYKLIKEQEGTRVPVSETASQIEQPKDEAPDDGKEQQNHAINISGYDLDILPSQVAAKVIPSVVCIQNYQDIRSAYPFAQSFEAAGQPVLAAEGSGIIYTEDGYIITNAHVVANSSLLKVVLENGEVYEAELVGVDEDTDLALLKIDAHGLTAIELGDYQELAVGDFVMAVGNPGGMEFSSSVTFGIVSAKDRPLDIDDGYTMNTIQTDAAINPGNSGGALVNMEGKLVGINSAKYVATGYEGLGFSITIEEALPIISDLQTYGMVKGRCRLGVSGMMIDSLVANRYGLHEGFYVNSVMNPNAGTLAAGDVIIMVDDRPIASQSDIKNVLQKKKAGEEVSIRYWRDGAYEDTMLTLVSADE